MSDKGRQPTAATEGNTNGMIARLAGGPRSAFASVRELKERIIAAEGTDPRYLALRNFALSITFLNIVGYPLLGLEQPFLWPLLALASAYSVELGLETVAAWAYRRRPDYLGNGLRGFIVFLLPAHITGLAFNFLFYAHDKLIPVLFGITVAVGTKWVLRAKIKGKWKHFMNPSNFGLVVCLLVFSQAIIAPAYHFTEWVSGGWDWVIALGLLTSGTLLNAGLTKKMPLIAAWAGAFVLQAVVRGIFEPHISMIAALAPMTGVGFILFTNYMITDPGTSPFGKRQQVIFGGSAGLLYGVLIALHVPFPMFFAVPIVCLARGGYWWYIGIRDWWQARLVTPGTTGESVAPQPTTVPEAAAAAAPVKEVAPP